MSAPSTKSKVVVAEAAPSSRRQLCDTLYSCGFEPLEAHSLDELLGLATRHSLELAVCNPNVSELDYEAFLGQVMGGLRPTRTKLVLTAHDRALGLRLAALRRGVANFVLLPAHPALLLRNLASPVAPAATTVGPARLLVVDDSVTYGNALADSLAEHGHDVVLAATAATAFEYLTLERPDLLLLDVFLPDSDGIELARTARAVSGLRHVPIVILTGRENTHVRQRALDASVSEFVAKNTPLSEICATVRRLLADAPGQTPRVEERDRAVVVAPREGAARAPEVPVRAAPFAARTGDVAAPAKPSSAEGLFARVVAESGLSEVLARSTLERALKRAGMTAPQLTPDGLRAALPEIERALATFLPAAETRSRMQAITALTRESTVFK